jgi:hypothetical protein
MSVEIFGIPFKIEVIPNVVVQYFLKHFRW